MKSFFQLLLLLLMILIAFFFYKEYFVAKKINKKLEVVEDIKEQNIELKSKNNFIKKLKYNVQLSGSGKYEINAKSSELTYIEGVEIVTMNDVTAIFIDKENRKISVRSDKARFNTVTNNTNFIGDIEILYLNNIITSEKLDFNFQSDNIIIFENVVYNGTYGKIKADNIRINLITKNIKIFMDNPKNKVKITSNY
jgi:lipopolysaccharide assembly outer membrane protein LptD (OstA)